MPFSRVSTASAKAARRGVAAAGIALLALIAATTPSHAQNQVTVRSGMHDSYGRLVFDWPKPVRFEASLSGQQLTVRFAEPLSADLSGAAVRKFDAYLARPVLSADRRTLTFDVVRPVTLRSFQNDRSTVIDLLKTDKWPATAEPKREAKADAPQEIAKAPESKPEVKPESEAKPEPKVEAKPEPKAEAKAEAKPEPKAEPKPGAKAVPVRVGQHDDFTRLKFEFSQPVEYRAEVNGGRGRIQFDKPTALDMTALRAALPRSVAAAEPIDNGVTFSVPRNAQLRHFRSGLAIVVDVLAPPNAASVAETGEPPVTVATANAPTPIAPPSTATAPTPIAAPSQIAAAPSAPVPNTPAPVAAPVVSAPVASAPVSAAPAPAAAPERAGLPTVATPALAQTPARAPEAKPVEDGPSVAVTGIGGRIRVSWKQQLPSAAVFARGNSVYVLFDKPAKFELASFDTPIKKGVERVAKPEVLAVNGGSGLRFTVAGNLNPQPMRENDAWVIALRNEARRPLSAAAVTVEQATSEGPRVAVSMSGADSMLTLSDPERGEPMRVVPVKTAGLGVDAGRQFAQFDILASNQGLIVVPRADGIDLRQTANAIVVGSNQGLALSRPAATPTASGGANTSTLFDMARWNESDVDFTETRQNLVRAVAEAEPARRAAGRFELAQFFLARNHAADAVGELNLIASEGGRYASDPALKALRGAARVMLRDGKAAKADLSDPMLANDTAVMPWRAGAAALNGEWAEADQLFRRAGQLPTTYPPALRQRLGLYAAEAALNAGDSNRVRAVLESTMRGEVPASVRAHADYLRARALIASDDRKTALPILQRLASANDQWSRAHGEYMLIDQQLADDTISAKEAIDRLDRVRFTWSGDALEYALLRRLGELQIEHGDVRSGLSRLREAVSHFPDNADNAAIRARMTDAFASLYDGNGPRRLPPLTALSLYDDFRDLTPPGPRGDTMIQNLADRLVAMDLLDRAGELLDYQIKNRLSGADKARIGARLAVVRLLDRKPAAAITALDDSEVAKLPPELVAERRYLKARALSETGDGAGALALLEGDTGKEADQLRAEFFVKAQSWGKAAQALDRVVGEPGQGVFDNARRRQILNLAIAYALAGDAEGLRSVRERFADRMASGANKDAFGLVTSITEGGAVSDKALSARFADLQEFQQFMAGYREKLRSSSLSAIN